MGPDLLTQLGRCLMGPSQDDVSHDGLASGVIGGPHHSRLGHRTRLPYQNARVERLGNQILRPELQLLASVGRGNIIGDWLLREIRDGMGGCHLHALGNLLGPDV